MGLNKTISKLVHKYLSDKYLNDENVESFIVSVNKLLLTYEKDKMLSEHSFEVSEKEYQLILKELKEQNEITKKSIARIHTLIQTLGSTQSVPNQDFDLISIISFLENKVEESRKINDLLVLAKENAENASKAKSNFLSIMSHEIKTPLNAIIGSIHILNNEEFLPSQSTYLKTLKSSSENLLNLINDVLDYNKIEEGKIVFEDTKFDIHHLLEEIIVINNLNSNESNNQLVLSVDNQIPRYVITDKTRLTQVLNNLISNAIKFTKNGFINLNVHQLETNDDFSIVEFEVIDTGIGIEKSKLTTIFERFTQANSNINREYGGSGLGLSIVKRILELQDSEIKVESTVGLGTKFYFNLKLKKIQEILNPIKVVQNKGIKDLNGINILLAEDTEVNVLIAKKMLTSWNAKVDVACNGEEAINLYEKNQYDIILMDLHMPVMDGLTATKRIRELGGDLPILALTASAFSEIKEDKDYKYLSGYIAKPFNPSDLYQKLSQIFSS